MKGKRKEVAIPECSFQFSMSRRSSSLVTVSLDDTTDEEIKRPDGTTPVIQIGADDDEIDAGDHQLSSSEPIFQVVVGVNQDVSTNEENVSSGCYRKTTAWFQTCRNERPNFGCCNQISDFFKRKLEELNEKLQRKCGNSYLESYFLYANVCGVSPFRFDKNKKRVILLKKVPYYVVSTFAAVDTAVLVKYVILEMIGANEERSANIGEHMSYSLTAANILLRAGLFVSLQLYQEKYSKMIQTISASSYSKHLYTIKVLIESLLICSSSFSLVLTVTNLSLLYGFEGHLIQKAKEIQSLICPQMWCPQIEPEGLNITTVALGLFGWATKFAGNMFSQIARDGMLFTALTLGKSANAFRFKQRVKNATSEEDATAIGTEILNDYKWIKKISKHVNSACNIVFRFFLLANIFMFAVVLDEWFNPHLGKVIKCLHLANIIFVCITFYFANQTAKTGDRFRDWVKKEKNRKLLGMSEINVQTEILCPSSIGLGRGAFFLHDSTLIGIASVVAAYYFGIVETRPQDNVDIGVEKCCDYFPNITCSALR